MSDTYYMKPGDRLNRYSRCRECNVEWHEPRKRGRMSSYCPEHRHLAVPPPFRRESVPTVASVPASVPAASAPVDTAEIREIVLGILAERDTGTPAPAAKPTGRVHASFDTCRAMIDAGLNVYLHGPAGTGKTHLAHSVADSLGLRYESISLSPLPVGAQIFGFTAANGQVVRTPFREVYENGGLFLFDEIDAGHAGDLTKVNQALANGGCSFPDGYVAKHPSFRCIAAANTTGNGASRQYVGRSQLDAATLDRFAFLHVSIDAELERELTGNDAWYERVLHYRNAAGNDWLVSPRASYSGAALLASGLPVDMVDEAVVFKGCPVSVRARMVEGCPTWQA